VIKVKKLVLVIGAVLLLTALISTPILASTVQRTTFTNTAVGQCVVVYQVDASPSDDYVEQASGNASFNGKASVIYDDEWGDFNMYRVVPGTLVAKGHLSVAWSHAGENYRLVVKITVTDETQGWVSPNGDVIVFGGSLPDAYPLEFKGWLMDGTGITAIESEMGMIAGSGIFNGSEIRIASLKLSINGAYYTFAWVSEPYSVEIPPFGDVAVPEATVLSGKVVITK
jgi:hypothetical protein